jgi:hypothetical protein
LSDPITTDHTNAARSVQEETMKATQKLHDIGQSLWLDNITVVF